MSKTGKTNKTSKSVSTKGKKESDVSDMKKEIAVKERELEEKFSRYEELVKQYAEQQSSSQQQRDKLEELTEAVKKQRLRCRTLQCDAILVANENELFKKKVEIVENKVKTLKEKHQSKKSGQTAAAKVDKKGKGGKTKAKPKADQELAKEIADAEEVAQDLKQEIADKTRSLYLRTGDISPFRSTPRKTEEVRSTSITEGTPRSA